MPQVTRGCHPVSKSAANRAEEREGSRCALPTTGTCQVCQHGSRKMAHKHMRILTPGTVNMLGYVAKEKQGCNGIKVANGINQLI